MTLLVKIVATFFGLGYCPIAPGTVASLVIILVHRFILPSSLWIDTGLFIVLFFSGVWASEYFSRSTKQDDPRQIVMDEACGQHLSVMALPASDFNLLLAFFLFRSLDIIKPFPINQTEKIKGGWGIMADDLAAGLLARFFLFIYHLFF